MERQLRGQTTPDNLGARAELLIDKHAAYIKKVADVSQERIADKTTLGADCPNLPLRLSSCVKLQAKDTLEAVLTEHFRLSGVYWGLTALYLIGKLHIMDGEAIVKWVRSVLSLRAAVSSAAHGAA